MSRRRVVLLLLLLAPVALAQKPPDEGIMVSGRVVDESDEPAAGATLRLLHYPEAHELGRQRIAGKEPEPVATTVSDDDGRFALAAPAPGMWILDAAAEGQPPVYLALTPLLEPRELVISLPPGRALEVSVRDDEGRPVAGARVVVGAGPPSRSWIRRIFAQRYAHVESRRQVAASDERGMVRLVVPREGSRGVVAVAPGDAAGGGLAGPRVEHLDQDRLELVLATGAARVVEVRGADGTPRPATLIWRTRPLAPLALTDDAGRATVVVPRGEDELRLVLRSPAGERGEAAVGAAADATNTPVAIELAAPTAVAGKVIDAAGREPLAGVLVWDAGQPASHVRSDGKGRFRIALGGRDGGTLRAAARGYFPVTTRVPPPMIAAGEAPTMALEAAGGVRGRVVDERGRPIADVEIEIRGEALQRSVRPLDTRARSGRDGRFALSPLPTGGGLELLAESDDYAPSVVELPALAAGAPREVSVVLRRGHALQGLIQDTDGLPLPGAELTLEPSLEGMSMRAMSRRVMEAEKGRRAASDGEGRFVFRDLPAGRFDLRVVRGGHAPATMRAIEIPASAGETELGPIVLEPGVTIAGVVVDEGGEPIRDADLRVREGGLLALARHLGEEEPAAATSGADGRFTIHDLRDGQTLELAAEREGYVSISLPGVRAPAEDVRVVLRAAARIDGVVVGPDGEGIERAFVRARLRPGNTPFNPRDFTSQMGSAQTDAEGHFVLEEMRAGTWDLSVQARRYQTVELTGVEVAPGIEREPLRIALQPGATVHGRVYGADGAPLVGAQISLVTTAAGMNIDFLRMPRATRTDGDGDYRLEGLTPGVLSFAAEHERHRKQVRDLEVRMGGNALDFQLARGWEIAGRVIDAEGVPVAGALVTVTASEMGMMAAFTRGTLPPATSGDDGTFVVAGLDDGSYRVRAEKEGYAAAGTEEPLRVEGASVSGVELRLARGGAIVGRIIGVAPERLPEVQLFASRVDSASDAAMASAGSDGVFRLDNLAAGDWHVIAMLEDGGRTARETVELPPGAGEVEVELDLGGGGLDVPGRVLLDDEPLAGVTVGAQGLDEGSVARAQTDREGRFLLEGLEPGRYRLMVLALGGTGLRDIRDIELPLAEEELVIALEAAAVTGRLVDEYDRAPIAGADVEVTRDDADGEGFSFPALGRHRSDDEGRFHVEGLVPGRYRLRASKEGYATTVESVALEGGVHDAGTLALAPSRGLTLHVHRPTGQPAAEVVFAVLDADERPIANGQRHAGEGGRVRLDELPAGSWTLVLGASGTATITLPVTAPGPPVDVRLPAPGGLRVVVPTLVDSLRDNRVELRDATGRRHRTPLFGQLLDRWPLRGGRLTVGDLLPGPWTVVVESGDSRWTATVQIVAGVTTEVVLE